jgi:DNA mismatch endonuclease (patch repair protein)
VHGCFWHGHSCKRGSRVPVTNQSYWEQKIEKNRLRDNRSRRALTGLGWKNLIIWECELRKPATVHRKLSRYLQDS